ncbi:hypothetical protein AEAC466_12545 [Asticcacaulis sp. AC466]|nr:hypothetical protein AEAC466_12545 [Asticcacaulis sp. AC466]
MVQCIIAACFVSVIILQLSKSEFLSKWLENIALFD